MKFYSTAEQMRGNAPSYADPFVVQWESPTSDERRYIVFDGVGEYLTYHSRSRYTTCHEVLISPSYNTQDDVYGHPAFDIDSPDPTICPDTLKREMMADIVDVLCKQYPHHAERIRSTLDTGSTSWVWMTSPSTTKMSKHLVITGICFSMWRCQMKTLVNTLISLNRSYSSYIDTGIMRRLGSLRLPLNHKRHVCDDLGNIIQASPILTFDNPIHKFTDGLIMIHDSNMYTMLNTVILSPGDMDEAYTTTVTHTNTTDDTNDHDTIDMDASVEELASAFDKIDSLYHTGLQVSTMSPSGHLSLVRKQPGTCPISGRTHDNVGAYLYKKGCRIFYGCHRGCSISVGRTARKCIDITPWTGKASEDNAMIINASMDI